MPTLKTTVTAIQFAIQMSYRRGCAVVLYFVLWGSGRHAGSLNMRLYSVLPSPLFSFFFFLFFVSATFKTQRGACTSGILFFPAWLALRNDTSLFLQRCSACFLQKRLTCLRLRGVRTWKSNAKSDLTVQTETDFQKCDLNRITNHIRM